MKRYGIIGGTFDPIHSAHLYIAYEAREKLHLDKVIFMPNGNPPHKVGKIISEGSLRYKMVSEGIKGYEGFFISDYEIKRKEPSFTYETLQALKEENVELFFISGADCLMELETWKKIDEIFKVATLVVFTRPGYTEKDLKEQKLYIEKKYNTEIVFLELKHLEISATDIRKRVKEGKRIDFFVPEKVLDIIKEKGLYK